MSRESNNRLPPPEAIDITDDKFDSLAKQTLELIQDCDLGKESMCPSVFVHARPFTDDNQLGDIETSVHVIASDFNDADDKERIMRGIGANVAKLRHIPIAVFLASEAWMSLGSKDKPPDAQIPPSQDPDRRECIIVAGKTITKDCHFGASITIKRNENNEMIQDGEIIKTKEIRMPIIDHFFRGYFMEIFNKAKQQHDEQDKKETETKETDGPGNTMR